LNAAPDGTLTSSGRTPPARMGEGKVALFISLDDPFPCVRANCFSPKCRGADTRFFNLGRLVPPQTTRLLRSLGSSVLVLPPARANVPTEEAA
jgi:hypothetical protein